MQRAEPFRKGKMMEKEDVIRMMRAVGAGKDDVRPTNYDDAVSIFARFAELVSQAECKKYLAQTEQLRDKAMAAEKWRSVALSRDGDGRTVQQIQTEAAAKERERCASLCDFLEFVSDGGYLKRKSTNKDLAERIRAMPPQSQKKAGPQSTGMHLIKTAFDAWEKSKTKSEAVSAAVLIDKACDLAAIQQVEMNIEFLKNEIEKLKGDALRYQWLRHNLVKFDFSNILIAHLMKDQSELDGAISGLLFP